jgi:DNA-binding MarR family transcriptional regulator
MRSVRQFLHFSEEAAKRAGVTPQQHQALLNIKGFPGRDTVTVGELAERLQLRHHTTVELVDRLAALKLVVQEHSGIDRRRAYVQLTRQGEQILDKSTGAHEEQLRRIGPKLADLLQGLGAEKRAVANVRRRTIRSKRSASSRRRLRLFRARGQGH